MPVIFFVLLLFVFNVMVEVHAGYPRVLFEREPNNTADEAQSVRGQARLVGEVAANDPAYFWWALDDAETDRDWMLELEGEGDIRLTLSRPAETESAAVTEFGAAPAAAPESTPLLKMQTSADQPVARMAGVIVPAGEVLLKLKSDGPPVAYQVTLATGDTLSVRRGQIGQVGGPPLVATSEGRDRIYQLEGPRHEIPLEPDADARDGSVWRLVVDHELGAAVEAWVENAAGDVVGERRAMQPPRQRWSRLAIGEGSRLVMASADGAAVGRARVALAADGRIIGQLEDEPNNSLEDANWADLSEGFSGQVAGRDRDFVAFTVSEAQTSTPLDITVEIDGDAMTACLGEIDGRGEICRSGEEAVRFHGIWLDAGEYFLNLSAERSRFEADYRVRMSPGAPTPEGHARKPFEARDWALTLPPGEVVAGHIDGDSEAWFELVITTRRQWWSFVAEGDALDRLRIEREGEAGFVAQAASRRPEPRWQIDRLLLEPGRYLVRLSGEDSEFRLAATPMGEPTASYASEPNDTHHTANSLRPGQPMRGRLHARSDRDYLHFHLPGWNHVRLGVEPEADGSLGASLEWEGATVMSARSVRTPLRLSQYLPPGDYYLRLSGSQVEAVDYAVDLELADPWTWHPGTRFFDVPSLAALIPPDGRIANDLVDLNARETLLRFPRDPSSRAVTLMVEGSYQGIEIRDGNGNELEVVPTDAEGAYTAELPGDEQWYLTVVSGRAWTMQVDDPALPELPAVPLEVAFEVNVERAAAWYPHAQRLTARLALTNPGEVEVTVPLHAHASHEGWQVDGLPDAIQLAPGVSKVLEPEWRLPAEASDDLPFAVHVSAGGLVAGATVALDADAPPVAPLVEPGFPEELAGLVNLAWHGLGARFVDPDTGEPVGDRYRGRVLYPHFLIDGLSIDGISIEARGEGEALPPLRLAGDGGAIHALTFNQRSSYGPLDRWRRVEIRYSEDGQQFEPLKTVELASANGQQYFFLDEPVRARYLEIRPLDIWGSRARVHGTGLFKALGIPAAGDSDDTRTNLLDPELGGHWVYSRPDQSRLYEFPDHSQEGRPVPITGHTVEVVFAMHQHRAARIEGMTWREDLEWAGLPAESVRVSTGTRSPVGPWTEQAAWALERDDDGVAELAFDEPVWARYLRLEIELPEQGRTREERGWRLPLAIEAFEADRLDSRASILGYWGHYRGTGPFERQFDAPEPIVAIDDEASSPEDPWPLDGRVKAQMAHPGDVRSYRVVLEAPDNTLAFQVEEAMPERLLLTLFDAAGEEVPVSWRTDGLGRRIGEAVGREPGSYRLDVEEPPRSIMYMWDESISVDLAQPAIHRALKTAGEGLIPGQEVGNYLALGGPPIIRGWAETPQQMIQGMARYDHRFTSSAAHTALGQVSRAMEGRKGEKIVFLIADVEFFGLDMTLWDDLERVRPRVFAIEVTNGGRNDIAEHRGYQQIMRGWANVGGGEYTYALTEDDVHRAMQRAMRLIRRPSAFTLAAEARYQDPPEDGQLTVVSGATPAVGAGVIHLIFDASGSMLRRMQGGRRIDVARRIVREVLDDRIPAQVPIAFRAYGHTEPHSCETELLVPPSVDNHNAVRAAVDDIRAINLARTPLAASLEAVLDDLADFDDRQRLVVMLTDGEETCEGDVGQAVAGLVSEGLDVRLNIVGFHIDEVELQADFMRYAMAGGGEYFDSQDGDELVEGLINALAARFRVLDATGREAARSRVDGEPSTLPPGTYEIVVDTSDGEYRKTVDIAPGQALEVRLSDR